MNIKKDIDSFLESSGWNVSRLAKEAGLAIPIVSRLRSGERSNMTLRTYEKLRPFLYGEKPHQKASGE